MFTLFRQTKSARQSNRAKASSFRPHLERLEDRELLTAGLLDTTFNSPNGYDLFNDLAPNSAESVAVQQDGKIVVSLGATIARLNPDGTPDTTFATNGRFTLGALGTASALAIQPDGKIVVAGDNSGDFEVFRLDANGTLDPNFANNGAGRFSFSSGNDYAYAVALESDGKIVVAGSANNSNLGGTIALLRLDDDGLLDPLFGTGGFITNSSSGTSGRANALAVGPDNKILVAGVNVFPNYCSLLRFDDNGTLDTSFGSSGEILETPGSLGDGNTGVALRPDGRILTSASLYNGGEIFAYDADGTPDTSFGDYVNGMRTGTVITSYRLNGLTLQADGKIIVYGPTTGHYGAFAVSRYTTVGDLDTAFGTSQGNTILSFPNNANIGTALAAAIQKDGKITVAGGEQPAGSFMTPVVARLTGDGPPTANDDDATTSENTAVPISVLANDTDADDTPIDPTTVAIVTAPEHGSTGIDPVTGVVTYTPTANFFGPDSFTYTVKDSAGLVSNVATVNITVTPAAADIHVVSATSPDPAQVQLSYEITGTPVTSFDIGVYRSSDSTFNADEDQAVDETTVTSSKHSDLSGVDDDGHPVGALGEHTVTVALDGKELGIDPSHKYVFVVADPGNNIPESNESNNTAYFRKWVIGAVTHGYQVDGNFPSWVTTMTDALVTKDSYDDVIPFDWAGQSNLAEPEWTTKEGGVLAFEIRVHANALTKRPDFTQGDVIDLQLIGHSRGADVISQAIQSPLFGSVPQLNAGYVKMTLLDPHPANNAFGLNADVNGFYADSPAVEAVVTLYAGFQNAARDPQILVPARVNELDDLYQKTSAKDISFLKDSKEHFMNLHGLDPSWIDIENPAKTHVWADDLTHPDRGHGEVPEWYLTNVVNPGLLGSNSDTKLFSPPPFPDSNDPVVGDEVNSLTSTVLEQLANKRPTVSIVLANDGQLAGVVSAVNQIGPRSLADRIVIAVILAGDVCSDVQPHPHEGVTLVMIGSQTDIIEGRSPALTVSSGTVIVQGITFRTDTDSPTIEVTGGNLILRDCDIEESTGFNQAAISITRGTIDLGTSDDPGGNTLNINGTGTFIRNTTTTPVTAYGDTFDINGQVTAWPIPLTSTTNSSMMLVGNNPPLLTGSVNGSAFTGATTYTATFGDSVNVTLSTAATSASATGKYAITAVLSGPDRDNYIIDPEKSTMGTMYVVSVGPDPSSTTGPKTVAFWSDKANRNLITAADLTALDALNLVTQGGSHFNPKSPAQLQQWLVLPPNATTAYQLSVQLAIMDLNVLAGYVHATDLIYAGGILSYVASNSIPGLTTGGFIDVRHLMNAVNATLDQVIPGNPSGDPNEAYETAMLQAVAHVNDNNDFVSQELLWDLVDLYPSLI